MCLQLFLQYLILCFLQVASSNTLWAHSNLMHSFWGEMGHIVLLWKDMWPFTVKQQNNSRGFWGFLARWLWCTPCRLDTWKKHRNTPTKRLCSWRNSKVSNVKIFGQLGIVEVWCGASITIQCSNAQDVHWASLGSRCIFPYLKFKALYFWSSS